MALRPPRRPRGRHCLPRQPGRSVGRPERHARRYARRDLRDAALFRSPSMFRLITILVLFGIGCGDREARSELKRRDIKADAPTLLAKAREGDAESVKLLLRAGCKPDPVEKWIGRT